jgi:hypothetical protein
MKTRQLSTNAKTIVEWLEKQNFKLHNKTGIPTHYPRGSNNKPPTLIDLCFSRGTITQWINTWFIDDDSTSDHSIIGIRITLPINRISCNIVKAAYVRAWSKADWSQFRSHIVSKQLDFSNISSKGESEDAIKYLKQSPLIKMKPKFVSWWSQNLEWLLTKVKRARKRIIKDRTLESIQIFENSRSNWESAVRKAKQQYWKQKFEQATNSSIWKINKKHTMAHTNVNGADNFIDKCNRLRSTLFPVTDQVLHNIPDNFVISKCSLSESFSTVSRSEVKRVLKAVNCNSVNSAVGSDKMTYTTLSYLDECSPDILPSLATALKFGHHYHKWKHAVCAIIPKQEKSSYNTAKSYRPISLLSCLGKIIEKIAEAGKICGAISSFQFGNKDNHLANDVLIRTLSQLTPFLISSPTTSYKNTKRPSLAAHDILGAFNNTIPYILLQIMTQRRMPTYLINWTKYFTPNRTLSFSFDNNCESLQPFTHAIPQGSPVSPILFSIMMSAILDADDPINLQTSTAYVDDLNEIHADVNTGKIVPKLSDLFMFKATCAAYHLQMTNLKLYIFQWQHVENRDFLNT